MKRKIAAQKNSPKDELGTSRSGANNRRGTIIIHQRYIEELKERATESSSLHVDRVTAGFMHISSLSFCFPSV